MGLTFRCHPDSFNTQQFPVLPRQGLFLERLQNPPEIIRSRIMSAVMAEIEITNCWYQGSGRFDPVLVLPQSPLRTSNRSLTARSISSRLDPNAEPI